MNFIEKYTKIMSKITDAPEEFKVAAAIASISTLVGRNITYSRDEELLNTWFMLIGKSRSSRMSTINSNIRKFLSLSERSLTVPSVFSPSAVVYILGKELDKGSKIWLSDETATFLKQMESTYNVVPFAMDEIYSGNSFSCTCPSTDRAKVSGPYLTALLTSHVNPLKFVKKEDFYDGFLNRFMYIVGEKSTQKAPSGKIPSKDVREIREFVEALDERSHKPPIRMEYTGAVLHSYRKFRSSIQGKYGSSASKVMKYYANLPEFVRKLSCIHRIARMLPREIRAFNESVLFVETEDLEWSTNYVRNNVVDPVVANSI